MGEVVQPKHWEEERDGRHTAEKSHQTKPDQSLVTKPNQTIRKHVMHGQTIAPYHIMKPVNVLQNHSKSCHSQYISTKCDVTHFRTISKHFMMDKGHISLRETRD